VVKRRMLRHASLSFHPRHAASGSQGSAARERHRTDRFLRHPQDRRDLRVAVPFHVEQHDGCPLPFREFPEGRREHSPQRAPIRIRRGPDLDGRGRRKPPSAAPPSLAGRPRGVGHDPEQPGPNVRIVPSQVPPPEPSWAASSASSGSSRIVRASRRAWAPYRSLAPNASASPA
jgi:hypothetical protein